LPAPVARAGEGDGFSSWAERKASVLPTAIRFGVILGGAFGAAYALGFISPTLSGVAAGVVGVAFLYFGVRWAFVGVVSGVEGKAGANAFTRSEELTEGKWLHTLGFVILAGLVSAVPGMVLYAVLTAVLPGIVGTFVASFAFMALLTALQAPIVVSGYEQLVSGSQGVAGDGLPPASDELYADDPRADRYRSDRPDDELPPSQF